ncbi:MAG: hypothetical protein VX983_06090, partial [Actinomycetota bacterium]|nr:hypothetical protein [Actinomycetota bacterium]
MVYPYDQLDYLGIRCLLFDWFAFLRHTVPPSAHGHHLSLLSRATSKTTTHLRARDSQTHADKIVTVTFLGLPPKSKGTMTTQPKHLPRVGKVTKKSQEIHGC